MVVSVLLIGGAGYFAYAQYTAYTTAQGNLSSVRDSWQSLEQQDPHPGTETVRNIEAANKDLTNNVQVLYNNTVSLFQPVPDILLTNATDLNIAVNEGIYRMTKGADLFGVTIKNDYNFTFRGQKAVVNYADSGSIPKYAFHLHNVERLVDAIFNARVHSLESIKRVKVDEIDDNSFGIMTEVGMTKDEFLLHTPYEISFKGFSSELASVIEHLANSKDVYIVKAMKVEPTELPVRPKENRKQRRTMMRPMPSPTNPYGGRGGEFGNNPYGGRGGGSQFGNTYGAGNSQFGNTYGGGNSQFSNTYGGGATSTSQFADQYGLGGSGNPARPRGRGGESYGGNPPRPGGAGQYGSQFPGMPGMNPYGPMQPQIQTRKKQVSDEFVISENPLLFQVQVHLVQYFDDPAAVDAIMSSAEVASTDDGSGDGYDSGYDDYQ